MPETTTKKKTPAPKAVGESRLAKRVKALESKIEEFDKKLTSAVDRIEMIKSAVAEGRMDKL